MFSAIAAAATYQFLSRQVSKAEHVIGPFSMNRSEPFNVGPLDLPMHVNSRGVPVYLHKIKPGNIYRTTGRIPPHS